MHELDFAAFRCLTYGLYVVASFRAGKLNGQIANVAFQVTAEPPLIAVSLNCRNLTNEFIKKTKKFSIAVLSRDATLPFIGTFGFRCGRDVDKFSGIRHRVLASGNPVPLDYCLAYFDLEVAHELELGSHTLFIGRVKAAEVLASQGEPLTYADYHKLKGGLSQKNAPTYVAPAKKGTGS